jgi:hypothetical protein
LGTIAAVGRLGFAGNQTAFAQEVSLNGIRRDKDITGFWMVIVFLRAKEAKTLLGNLQKTGAEIGGRGAGRIAHRIFLCKSAEVLAEIPLKIKFS